MTIRAAGILFVAPDDSFLLVKRAKTGEWAFPGGKIEDGETPEMAAVRECREELGFCPLGPREQFHINHYEPADVYFMTFLQRTAKFDPALDHEHTEYLWLTEGAEYPEPMHPGALTVLDAPQGGLLTTDKANQFFTVEQLSPKMHLTPEGFLLCEDVPIARTGVLYYADGEIDIRAASLGGMITIERDEGEVFHPDTIASYLGKSITMDHPLAGPVIPENWRLLELGCILNPHRGSDGQKDLLLVDFLIKDPDAIKAVLAKEIREVSCGYNCEYEETGPGRGRQIGIIGNHVALVDKGRCGPRCAIGDSAMAIRTKLKTTTVLTQDSPAMAKLKLAIKSKDKAAADMALAEVLSGDEDPEIRLHVDDPDDQGTGMEEIQEVLGEMAAKLDDFTGVTGDRCMDARMKDKSFRDSYARTRDKMRMDKMARDAEEKEKEEKEERETADRRMRDAAEGKEPDEDEPGKKNPTEDSATRDSASLAGVYQQTIANAEILVPGIRFPTFDHRANYKLTRDALCALRRRALGKALDDEDTAIVIRSITGDKAAIGALDCAIVAERFNSSAEVLKVSRASGSATRDAGKQAAISGAMTFPGSTSKVLTPAEINAKNKAFYADKH